jgi:tetratricopeptide (TPR) repeat protein
MATARLHQAIAQHLERQAARGGEHAEGFEVAAQLVRGSLGEHEVLEAESSTRELLEIFIAGEAALSARATSAAPPVTAPSAAEAAPAAPAAPAASFDGMLEKFVQNLERRGFFAGTVEGSDEYTQRYERARSNFRAKFGDRLQAAPVATAASSALSLAPAGASDAEQAGVALLAAAAEVALRAEDFENAVAAATRAMDADLPSGRLARLLLVRASAHLGLREFDAAISDAETSLALEPDGESAAGALLRLGRALEGLGKPVEAIERGCAFRTCSVLLRCTCTCECECACACACSYCACAHAPAHMRLHCPRSSEGAPPAS